MCTNTIKWEVRTHKELATGQAALKTEKSDNRMCVAGVAIEANQPRPLLVLQSLCTDLSQPSMAERKE